jgi:hypothetical protein
LPNASCNLPGRQRKIACCASAPAETKAAANMPSLFGFAPGGVYLATTVTSRAVRSYRTLSPLPIVRDWLERQAVYFLWHFPWGRPRRALPGTVFSWSPDFPPPPKDNVLRQCPKGKGDRPAVWQHQHGDISRFGQVIRPIDLNIRHP